MSIEWGSLPLLPLRCILEHLSMEDALAAMSTCHHWRSSLLLYEGRRDTLVLTAGHLDKCLFLTRIFRKYTKRLLIFIDCGVHEMDKFNNFVLPQFFDTVKLEEILFISSYYALQTQFLPIIKLKRILIESLLFKHSHCLRKFAFVGCELDLFKMQDKRYTHKDLDYYSTALTFNSVPSPADSVMSRCNMDMLMYCSLKHIMVDYDQINTEALETLSNLVSFSYLSMNITRKCQSKLNPIAWDQVMRMYPKGLDVGVNIIAIPTKRFKAVIENILVEGLTLTSLKVLFCQYMYIPLISHIVRLYQTTLRELVWADPPYEANDSYRRYLIPQSRVSDVSYNVHPFILLCWQCVELQRLVIHGYWVWQYDLLGFVRLRRGLCQLEVSAIFQRHDVFRKLKHAPVTSVVRVLVGDTYSTAEDNFVDEVNKYTEFRWKPAQWSKLHPALRPRSTPEQRLDYIVQEIRRPLGIK